MHISSCSDGGNTSSLVLSSGAKDLFDTEIFLDRAELVKYNLVCPICTYAADEVVETVCGHLFCRACILASVHSTKSECPVCRKSLRSNELHVSTYLQRMVDDMRVRCIHHPDCSEWQGRRGDLARHLGSDCGHVLVPCRWCKINHKRSLLVEHESKTCPRRDQLCDHCHQAIMAERMNEHRSSCPALPISCPNDCKTVTMLPRSQLAHHLSTSCPLAESPCPFGRWGCEFGGLKGTLPLHLTNSESMSSHLSLLERQCVRLDGALLDAEEKDRRTQDILQQQQSTIMALQQQIQQLFNLFQITTGSNNNSPAISPNIPLSSSNPNIPTLLTSSNSSSSSGLVTRSTSNNTIPPPSTPNNHLLHTLTSSSSTSTPLVGHATMMIGIGGGPGTAERKVVIETPKRGMFASPPPHTPGFVATSIHAGRPPPVSTRVERKNHHLRLQVGAFFDIQDTYGKWLEAEIMKVAGNKCLVHYLKWDSKWDEWFCPDEEPYRVAEFHAYSSGDTTGRYVLGQRVLIYPPKPRPPQWYEGEVAKIDGQNILVLFKAKEQRWWFHAESDCIVTIPNANPNAVVMNEH